MKPHYFKIIVMCLAMLWSPPLVAVQQDRNQVRETVTNKSNPANFLDLPPSNGPVRIRVAFHLMDIHGIDEENETFEFTGVLTLKWLDKRQAFDPADAGVDEKIYQGDYQINELSPAWYPQVVLTNASGEFEKSAALLRVEPNGSTTLIQTVNAIADTELDLRRTPFDAQRLEAVFEVFGFDTSDALLEAEPLPEHLPVLETTIPQWRLTGLGVSTRQLDAPYVGQHGVSSAFILTVDVKRQPFFALRLVVLPLAVIVMLSWSVFWMDRSSLGDRMSVTFVGILTAVTYQLVQGSIMPQISYLTFMNGFLNISFLVMCSAVVINLIVGAADKRGDERLGDWIDRRCRVLFPIVYFGLVMGVFAIVLLWQ